MKAGEVFSAILLVVGFGLQFAATSILRSDFKEFKETDGIIVLISGMAVLLLFGLASGREDEITHFYHRIKNRMTTQRKSSSHNESCTMPTETAL